MGHAPFNPVHNRCCSLWVRSPEELQRHDLRGVHRLRVVHRDRRAGAVLGPWRGRGRRVRVAPAGRPGAVPLLPPAWPRDARKPPSAPIEAGGVCCSSAVLVSSLRRPPKRHWVREVRPILLHGSSRRSLAISACWRPRMRSPLFGVSALDLGQRTTMQVMHM